MLTSHPVNEAVRQPVKTNNAKNNNNHNKYVYCNVIMSQHNQNILMMFHHTIRMYLRQKIKRANIITFMF